MGACLGFLGCRRASMELEVTLYALVESGPPNGEEQGIKIML